jgi:hypothetical protein
MARPHKGFLPGDDTPSRPWLLVCVYTLLGLFTCLGLGVTTLLVLVLLVWR